MVFSSYPGLSEAKQILDYHLGFDRPTRITAIAPRQPKWVDHRAPLPHVYLELPIITNLAKRNAGERSPTA